MKKRKPGGRPTKAEAAELDARVLDGARALFGERGIANSSVDELAVALGVSKHTIYRRFPNKASLLEAVVERDIDRFRKELSAAGAESTDALESVRLTALRYFRYGSSRGYATFYLSLSAEASVSAELRSRLAGWTKHALEPLVAAVSAARSAGHLQAESTSVACEILVDLLEGANNRVRLRDEASRDRRSARKIFDQRWRAFLAAMTVERQRE